MENNYTDYSKIGFTPVESREVPATDPEPIEVTQVETIEPEVDAEEVIDTIAVEAAQLEVDAEEKTEAEPAKPEFVKGIVTADRLNVRQVPSPNGTIAAVLNKNTKVRINIEKSTLDWHKVSTSTGVSGYCMKKFIEVK